jgi:hypothetical protein
VLKIGDFPERPFASLASPQKVARLAIGAIACEHILSAI